METQADLETLAKKLNPRIGFWDPIGLAQGTAIENDNEATIGWIRHAEIKHGRVAMAAFVGYLLQSNGACWPWMCTDKLSFADIAAAGSPPDQWDALPFVAKFQIIWFIGTLEFIGESTVFHEQEGRAHYTRKGGIPGKYPSLRATAPHPVPLDLYDPLGLNSKKTRQQLDQSLLSEINNGRLAMLGIMAFCAEQKIPGAVPALKGLVKPYAGEFMSPFEGGTAWEKATFAKAVLKGLSI
jgi:hypothetical protein